MSIAAAHGIPSWIVELRHDGTHNQLPSINVLRAASKHMVKWFYDNYWEVQHRHIKRLMEEGAESSDSPTSRKLDRGALGALGESCNTSITGVFIPYILLGGGRDPGLYYADFVDSSGNTSRAFEHLCRGSSTAAIDAVLARVFVCAMDEVDIYTHKESPNASDEEALLATLVVCKDLLTKASEPWQEMHSTILGEGAGAMGGEHALQEISIPMTLLKLYWATLLSRAETLAQGLTHRVPDGAQAVLLEMTTRFRTLEQVLASYSVQEDTKEDGEETAGNVGMGSGGANGNCKKRRNCDCSSQVLPTGWTEVEPGAGGAWPLRPTLWIYLLKQKKAKDIKILVKSCLQMLTSCIQYFFIQRYHCHRYHRSQSRANQLLHL